MMRAPTTEPKMLPSPPLRLPPPITTAAITSSSVPIATVGSPCRRRDSYITPASPNRDRKSTRLNSSHDQISYAVFCLKTKEHTSELQSRSDLVCSLLLDTATQRARADAMPPAMKAHHAQ